MHRQIYENSAAKNGVFIIAVNAIHYVSSYTCEQLTPTQEKLVMKIGRARPKISSTSSYIVGIGAKDVFASSSPVSTSALASLLATRGVDSVATHGSSDMLQPSSLTISGPSLWMGLKRCGLEKKSIRHLFLRSGDEALKTGVVR